MEHVSWTEDDVALYGDALYGLSYEDGLQEIEELDQRTGHLSETTVQENEETVSGAAVESFHAFLTLPQDIEEGVAHYHDTPQDDMSITQDHHSYDSDNMDVSMDQSNGAQRHGTATGMGTESTLPMITDHESQPAAEHRSQIDAPGVNTTVTNSIAVTSPIQAVKQPQRSSLPLAETANVFKSEERGAQSSTLLSPRVCTATPPVARDHEPPSSDGKSSLIDEMRSEEKDSFSRREDREVEISKLRLTARSDVSMSDNELARASEAEEADSQLQIDITASNGDVSAPLTSVQREWVAAREQGSGQIKRKVTRSTRQDSKTGSIEVSQESSNADANPAKRKRATRNSESSESLLPSDGHGTKRRKTSASTTEEENSAPQVRNLRPQGQRGVRRSSVRDELTRLTESRFLNGETRPHERSGSRQLRSQKLEEDNQKLVDDKKKLEEAKKRREEAKKASNAGRAERGRRGASGAHVEGFYKA